MNNPLRHVGQTARPEESPAPGEQAGDGSAEARQQDQTDQDAGKQPARPGAGNSAAAGDQSKPPSGQKRIRDLEPGEPPPESSAGS